MMEDPINETASSRLSSLVSHLLKLHIYGKAVFEVLEQHGLPLFKQNDEPEAVFLRLLFYTSLAAAYDPQERLTPLILY